MRIVRLKSSGSSLLFLVAQFALASPTPNPTPTPGWTRFSTQPQFAAQPQSQAAPLATPTPTPGCGLGTYQPQVGGYNPIHQAMVLTDPLGEQTAKFDLAFGGTLVSLKYQGVELIYGAETGAQVQPTWFAGSNPELVLQEFYNPETGGDNALGPPTDIRGNPTHGAYCTGPNSLAIVAGTTDYFLGRSGHRNLYTVYSTVVQRGNPNPFAEGCSDARINCAQFTTPYTVTTFATFVPNLSGALPHYYLKLTQVATNASLREGFAWGFSLAAYATTTFTNSIGYPSGCVRVTFEQCTASSTPDLVAGAYPNAAHTGGVAIFTSPSTYWNFFPGLSTAYITLAGHNFDFWVNAGPGKHWPLGPGRANRWVWYVMAGNWSAALNFAAAN